MKTTTLYDRDIHAWSRQTADVLKQHRFQDIDVERLIEALDSMGRRGLQELIDQLKILARSSA